MWTSASLDQALRWTISLCRGESERGVAKRVETSERTRLYTLGAILYSLSEAGERVLRIEGARCPELTKR